MTQPPMREERKIVTALFADVVGSTALGDRLDPEDVREIVGSALGKIVEVVESWGGTVKDLAGDGALVLFGAPVAHEDDPERAVRAGLTIVREMGRYAVDVTGRWGIPGFGVRVGIETGLVVLGPVGAGRRVEYGATGDAVNTAARLQAHAAPGTVLVGEATYRRVSQLFEWSAPQRLELKGKAGPVVARQVLRPRAGPSAVRSRELSETALVSRDGELEVLAAIADALQAGQGGILVVTGEAGVGKSRLLRELQRRLEGGTAPVLWLEGRCASYAESVPYWPFREVLGDWLAAGPEVDEAELGRRLGELFGAVTPEILPFARALIGRDPGPAVADLSSEALQRRIFETVQELLERLAARNPVAVALDDLHWADPTSIQLVERLIPVSERTPVLLVLAARPEERHPSRTLLEMAKSSEAARELALDVLSAGADGEFLARLVGAGTLPPSVERRVLEAAEGNPFYLEELVRSLVDAGALRGRENGWAFDQEVAVAIPETVEKAIVARLDRLPPPSREVLDAACVIGRRFDLALLDVVADATATPDAVEDLTRLGLIALERNEPELEYRFRHALIQEAAYRSLLRPRRRELHLRAAKALQTGFRGRTEAEAALLARHFRAAGELRSALDLLHQAGQEARRAYAVDEALRDYTEALEVAADLGMESGDPLVAQLRLERGEVRARMGEIAGARADLEMAVQGARQAGDRATETRALDELGFLLAGAADYRQAVAHLEAALRIADDLSDASERVRILSRLSIVFTNQASLDQAIERGRSALALAQEARDARGLAAAMDALEVAAVMIGDFDAVNEIAPALAAIHRQTGDLWYLQFALFQWTWPLIASGKWEAALERMEEARAVNRRIADRGNEPMYLATLCWIHRSRGDYGPALKAGRQAMATAIDLNHAEWTGWSAGILGWALLDTLALDEATECLARGLGAAEGAGARIHEIRCASHLAQAYLLAGDRTRASTLADRAERLLDAVSVPSGRAFLQGADANVAVARVRLATGAPQRAERMVAPVVAAGESSGWHEVAGSAAVLVGRCRLATGDVDGAERALAPATRAAMAAGLPRVSLEAHAALATIARIRGRVRDERREKAAARAAADRLSAGIGGENIARGLVEAVLEDLDGGSG